MLVLHSFAFGFYMLSIVVYYTIYTINVVYFKSNNLAYPYMLYMATMINIISSFLA
jgi:hypothetical protein